MVLSIKPKLGTKLLGSFGSHRSSGGSGSGDGISNHLNFRCILITFCLAAIIYELCWVISVLVGWISASDQIMTMDSFSNLGSSGSKKDLTNISWAHAVNSKESLKEALKGSEMMIEADILMGVKEGSDNEESIPIMAHPPAKTSDLSFNDFLSAIIKYNKDHRKDSKIKGIKLDFKQIECVGAVLKRLSDKKKDLTFPIWLNADVLRGPVNATRDPIDGNEFLPLIKKYLSQIPHATVSLGWTTRFGSDDGSKEPAINIGQYTQKHTDEMLKLWDSFDMDGTPVTFPVRVAIASQSADILHDFLQSIGSNSTLTLWSPVDDTVNATKIANLIEVVGRDRVYCDLPFPFSPHSDTDPAQVFHDTTQNPHGTNPQINNDTDAGNRNNTNEGSAPNVINKGLTLISLTSILISYFL